MKVIPHPLLPENFTALERFVTESNAIEGIEHTTRKAFKHDIKAHLNLLAIDECEVLQVNRFVKAVAGADIRDKNGMNVVVGNHHPPPGGWQIHTFLRRLLAAEPGVEGWAEDREEFAYLRHCEFETLHPYMDGNGRAGRALWLRDMGGPHALLQYGFLQLFYYQSLTAYRNNLDAL